MNKNKEEYQEVFFGQEAYKQLLAGATTVAKAVKSTMGPSGHSVIIDTVNGTPFITKDGVSVARAINLKEKLPRMGANLLKEVAGKTNELSGDGSTTATVLGHAMFQEGVKMLATGRSSVGLKRGMEFATTKILEVLRNNAIKTRDTQDVISVGTISANGDRQIGELLSEAITKVGPDGIITIEPAKSVQTTLDVVEGMQFDNGYVSPYFVTNQEKMSAELVNPYVLVTNKKISVLKDIVNLLETVMKQNRPLLIIGDDIEGEALHTLILNKMRNNIQVCAVKAPSYGDFRIDILSDIGLVTNAHVFDAGSAEGLSSATISHLGTCKKVIVTRNSTTIVGDNSNAETKKKVAERVATLQATLMEGSMDDLRRDKCKQRLAKLSGGVAIIRVGGSTEVEILEKKDRVEDALNATVAAVQEGIVPGGGCALFYAADFVENAIDNWLTTEKEMILNRDERAGVDIVLTACKAPLRTIVENTGNSPDVVINRLLESVGKLPNWNRFGYDAAKNEFGDLIDRGIIDPLKVERFALEHATSVISLVLTCDAVIVNNEDDKD